MTGDGGRTRGGSGGNGGGERGSAHGNGGIDFRTVGDHTVMGVLGIETLEAGPERVVLQVPVTERVHQPYGILHGGVSALLAETAASYGGALAAPPGHHVVGIELNASHLRPMRDGILTAVATPIRTGRTVHVWDIVLTDQDGRAICRARCTLAVVPSPGTGSTQLG